MTSPPAATLFADLNCPFCYALEVRLTGCGLMDEVEWCGVQHARQLHSPMSLNADPYGAEVAAEVVTLARIAPEVPIVAPTSKPNTADAIAAIATAAVDDAPAAATLRERLLHAFWLGGADVSDPEVLTSLGAPAPDVAGLALAEAWDRRWQEIGTFAVPTLAVADRGVITGLVDEDALRRAFG